MDNFETNLYKALSICNDDIKYLTEYSKIYSFTTENINGYIKYFDFNNKNLLTVGSSGDQVLNAYYHGARDITLYDINPYAKYYLYLKIAAILSLNYIEFKLFFFKFYSHCSYNENMFSKRLFNKIKPTLRLFDYESFIFFDELFSNYEAYQIRSCLFDDDESRNEVIKNFNAYLKDEESYNKLKSIIKNITFKYQNGDIFKDNIEGKFDNIFLSNLCTITDLKILKELLNKLDLNNLKQNGSILFGYLWNTSYLENSYEDYWKDIYKLPITKEVFKNYITEYHQIKDARDYLWNEFKNRDLVLIYRKNN